MVIPLVPRGRLELELGLGLGRRVLLGRLGLELERQAGEEVVAQRRDRLESRLLARARVAVAVGTGTEMVEIQQVHLPAHDTQQP